MNFSIFKYISIKYFKHNIKELLYIVISCILCIAILFCGFNFKISYEMYQYNNELEAYGDYDFLFYDLTDEEFNKIETSEIVTKSGRMQRVGTGITDDEAYYIIGTIDENASSMLSVTKEESKLPKEKNDVLISKELLQKNEH
jgi:hypothetical protein